MSKYFRIVPKLFYSIDHVTQDPVTAHARSLTSELLDPIIHEWSHTPPPLVHGLVRPYRLGIERTVPNTEAALSRVVTAILHKLNEATDRNVTVSVTGLYYKLYWYHRDVKMSVTLKLQDTPQII